MESYCRLLHMHRHIKGYLLGFEYARLAAIRVHKGGGMYQSGRATCTRGVAGVQQGHSCDGHKHTGPIDR